MTFKRSFAIAAAMVVVLPSVAWAQAAQVQPPPLRPPQDRQLPLVGPSNAQENLRNSPLAGAPRSDGGATSQSVTIPLDNLPPAMRTQIGNSVVNEMVPVTPETARNLRVLQDEVRRALQSPTVEPPGAVSRSFEIQPGRGGAAPAVIRLFPGQATSVVFTDSTGAPWPVANVLQGADDAFKHEVFGENSPTIGIVAQHLVVRSNILVRLKDFPTPISLRVETNNREIDDTLTVRVLARGPNAAAPLLEGSSGLEPGDRDMVSFVDGVPPTGARRLDVSGFAPTGSAAWLYAGNVYLQTPGRVLAPAYDKTVRHPSGAYSIFRLPETPIVSIVHEGRAGTVRLQERPIEGVSAR
ncbi:MAG: hypothetical protein ING19_11315 [Azospirillum sp.]|nr:hypothetical protein [Azospirillum sp.]